MSKIEQEKGDETLHSRDLIKISAEIKKDVLLIELSIDEEKKENILCKVQIFFDHRIVKQYEFSKENVFAFRVEKSGGYLVRVVAQYCDRILPYTQKCIRYYSDRTRVEYEKFLSEEVGIFDHAGIPLFSPQLPYQNFGIIFSKNTEKTQYLTSVYPNLKEISNDLIVTSIQEGINRKVVALSNTSVFSMREDKLLFSGRTKYGNKIILGQHDIDNDMDVDRLMDEVGLWTAIRINKNTIEIRNDYFGMYSIYYYDSDGIFAASNNYHLLVLLLSKIGISLSLNMDRAMAYLMFAEKGMFEQRFSYAMDIDHIWMLPADKYILLSISSSVISIKNKPINEQLQTNISWNSDTYKALVKSVAQDILHNVEIALGDERFEKIVIDVTGGKDSRTVLAAVTNYIYKCSNRVLVNSKDVATTNDKKVFIGLNNMFKLDYDTLPEDYYVVAIKEKELRNRSFFLGTSYSQSYPWFLCHKGEKNKLKLTGAGGEAIFRPYFPHLYTNLLYCEDQSEFVIDLIESFENSIIDVNLFRDTLTNEFSRTLNILPGNNLKEKFDNHYMFFRNVYHFGLKSILDSTESCTEQWQPLWSKEAIIPFRMVFNKYCNFKFQIDLIAQLNPILAILPFESNEDNDERERIKDELLLNDVYKSIFIQYNDDSKKWERANMEKASNRIIVNKEENEHISALNKQYLEDFYSMFAVAIRKLILFGGGYASAREWICIFIS